MKVVIKVGSQAILSTTGEVLESRLQHIVEQILELQRHDIQVVLVSSGAVALGRGTAKKIAGREYNNSVADKQFLASLGQPRLMAIYARLCEQHDVMAAQLLLTKYDFQTKRSYTNILRLLQKSLSQPNVLTIINENDSVAIDELVFTDNDELSGIIAAQIDADKLIILTSVNGVYDTNPSNTSAKLISEINLNDRLPELTKAKTTMGRGGMLSKLGTARKIAAVGVMTHIVNAAEPDVIVRLLLKNELLGSRILPHSKKSARKRYLAFGSNTIAATITINQGLIDALFNTEQSISILPVGIEKYSGEFNTGDLIEILTPTAIKIGVGVARYNSQKLSEYIGGKYHPAFIHYNYLHIDYTVLI